MGKALLLVLVSRFTTWDVTTGGYAIIRLILREPPMRVSVGSRGIEELLPCVAVGSD